MAGRPRLEKGEGDSGGMPGRPEGGGIFSTVSGNALACIFGGHGSYEGRRCSAFAALGDAGRQVDPAYGFAVGEASGRAIFGSGFGLGIAKVSSVFLGSATRNGKDSQHS